MEIPCLTCSTWSHFIQDKLKISIYLSLDKYKCIKLIKFCISYLYPPQTLFVGGILFSRCPSVRPSVHPSVTLCFLNNSKSHCWIFIKPCKHVHICKTNFIKPCKHVHICKTNTLDKKVRARGLKPCKHVHICKTNFIKPCKHVHICKTNTLDKKVRARGQFY